MQTPATTQATPSSTTPQATPTATPSTTTPPPAFGPQTNQTPTQTTGALALDDVLRLAVAQVSALQQAQLNERIAAEDVRQARAAFLPKLTAPLDYIYTSPTLARPAGEPRSQSFIANNAIAEYQALLSVGGDIDISGRLRAMLARANALLEAARAGTQVARRTLEQTTVEAYYGLALANAERRSAEQNLAAAQEYHERALTIQERLAPKSLDVALSLGELGATSARAGKLREATTYFGRASRKFIIGTRLRPPARIFASSPSSASRATASATLCARW